MRKNKIYSVMFEWTELGTREDLINGLKEKGYVIVEDGSEARA